MRWANELQRARACRVILTRADLGDLWTADGPSERACELLEDGAGELGHGAQVLLRVAFDLWNGHGKASVADLVDVLDRGNLAAVAGLLLALSAGPAAVDAWLEGEAPAEGEDEADDDDFDDSYPICKDDRD